jgi:hypothetical protein
MGSVTNSGPPPPTAPIARRAARSLPFGGGCAVLLGAVIAAFACVFGIGLVAVLVFAERGLPRDQKILAPPTILFVFLLGCGLIWTGYRDWRRAARAKEQAALNPGAPWFADWAWDRTGVDADSGSGGGAGLLVMLFILMVIAPFNVLWLHVFDPTEDPTMRLLSLMVLIPDLFIFLLVRGVASLVRDRVRFGKPRLRFEGFPFFVGADVRAHLTARAFQGRHDVSMTLRCIDERMVETRSSDGDASDSVQGFTLFESRQTFDGPFPKGDVPLAFPLPRGVRATRLVRQPPRYWELEVGSARDTVTFLVPVYAWPGEEESE